MYVKESKLRVDKAISFTSQWVAESLSWGSFNKWRSSISNCFSFYSSTWNSRLLYVNVESKFLFGPHYHSKIVRYGWDAFQRSFFEVCCCFHHLSQAKMCHSNSPTDFYRNIYQCFFLTRREMVLVAQNRLKAILWKKNRIKCSSDLWSSHLIRQFDWIWKPCSVTVILRNFRDMSQQKCLIFCFNLKHLIEHFHHLFTGFWFWTQIIN